MRSNQNYQFILTSPMLIHFLEYSYILLYKKYIPLTTRAQYNFLANSSFDFVIISWVIHNNEILQDVLTRLKQTNFKVYPITLMCNEKELSSPLGI